jgi:hypothetical protein
MEQRSILMTGALRASLQTAQLLGKTRTNTD